MKFAKPNNLLVVSLLLLVFTFNCNKKSEDQSWMLLIGMSTLSSATGTATGTGLSDNTGTRSWTRLHGPNTGAVWASDIAADSAGNSYALGRTNTASTIGGLSITGTDDAVIVKFDASGTLLWTRIFGGASSYTGANDIVIDSSGNIFLMTYQLAFVLGHVALHLSIVMLSKENFQFSWKTNLHFVMPFLFLSGLYHIS